MGAIAEALHPTISTAALIALWRAHPHPALADAIDRAPLATDVDVQRETQSETIDVLTATLRLDSRFYAEALPVFPVGPLRTAQAHLTQLAGHAERQRDPRIAARLIALFADPPYRTRTALGWWQQVIDVITRIGDPRSRDALIDLLPRLDESFSEPLQSLLYAPIESAIERLSAQPPTVDAADEAAIAALVARWQPREARTVAELEAAIYAEPDERELRLVYADACQRAGDPRGEFIALQALDKRTAPQRARLKQLLSAHRAEWLGPLDRLLLKSSVRFELGFLSEATLKPKHGAHVTEVLDDPRWATVRRLALADLYSASMAAYAAEPLVEQLVRSTRLDGLTALSGAVRPTLATALAEGRPRAIAELDVYDTQEEHRDALHAAYAAAPGLPALDALIWRTYSEVNPTAAILDSPVLRRLTRFGIVAWPRALPRWLEIMRATGLQTLRLSDFHDHREVRFEQTPKGLQLHARFRWPGMSIGGVGDGLMILCSEALDLPRGTFESVTLRWTSSYGPRAAQREAVAQMLDHLQPKKRSVSK